MSVCGCTQNGLKRNMKVNNKPTEERAKLSFPKNSLGSESDRATRVTGIFAVGVCRMTVCTKPPSRNERRSSIKHINQKAEENNSRGGRFPIDGTLCDCRDRRPLRPVLPKAQSLGELTVACLKSTSVEDSGCLRSFQQVSEMASMDSRTGFTTSGYWQQWHSQDLPVRTMRHCSRLLRAIVIIPNNTIVIPAQSVGMQTTSFVCMFEQEKYFLEREVFQIVSQPRSVFFFFCGSTI